MAYSTGLGAERQEVSAEQFDQIMAKRQEAEALAEGLAQRFAAGKTDKKKSGMPKTALIVGGALIGSVLLIAILKKQ